MRARQRLRDRQVLAPADPVLRRRLGPARQAARSAMIERMEATLCASQRERLDGLVDTGDDRFSALNRIKASPPSPSALGMRRLLGRLELIEATGATTAEIGWINGNYQQVLFNSVRTASAARLREMLASRRRLALVSFLRQAWRDTLDQAVDMYSKLLERNRKQVESRLDEKLKAQRHTVDRVVLRYRAFGSVLFDPGVDDAALRARLVDVASEQEFREDDAELARWTRGDRPARFVETARRHASLSRFAAPFLSRMEFLDEGGRSKSSTLEGLRAYRELRKHGRRALPEDLPVDFVPKALGALVRHDGAVDRRRWESALFLKVIDEIRAGNLAIAGAKNFGRFESFFLPDVAWQRTRDYFWARTGFRPTPTAPWSS